MVIQNNDEINKISKKHTSSVKFNLSNIDKKENEEWEKKFNSLLSDCGCNTGQRYLLFLLPIGIISIAILLISNLISIIQAIYFSIGTSFVIGIIGKVVGIRKRNRKVKELIVSFNKKYSFMSN